MQKPSRAITVKTPAGSILSAIVIIANYVESGRLTLNSAIQVPDYLTADEIGNRRKAVTTAMRSGLP
jgi:hypothetical protein